MFGGAEAAGVAEVRDAAARLREALERFDPAVLTGPQAARLTGELARTEKMCATARARAAARAADCGAHRDAGHARPADWAARESGTTPGKARNDMETVELLEDTPATAEAARRGEVSLEEASEIARTEAAAPGSEADLLAAARRGEGLRRLREQARRRRQEAAGETDLAERRRRARQLRWWIDELGMLAGVFRLLPADGRRLQLRLEAEIDRQWRAGDADYRAQPFDARAADALVALLFGRPATRHSGTSGTASDDTTGDEPADHTAGDTPRGGDTTGDEPADETTGDDKTPGGGTASDDATGDEPADETTGGDDTAGADTARDHGAVHGTGGGGREDGGEGGRGAVRLPGPHPSRPELVFVYDVNRGTAHIPGTGPVDHATVRQAAAEAIISLCLHDGEQITHIVRDTRSYPAALRLLLELGAPPGFHGARCIDCGARWRLQRDHQQPLAAGGLTELPNLPWRCHPCHHAKTQRERQAGLYRRGPEGSAPGTQANSEAAPP